MDGSDSRVTYPDIYTPLSEAREEIGRRRRDMALCERIRVALGGDIPNVFLGDFPKAFLFRYIATPNFEYLRALECAGELGIDLIYLEYLDDKFCTINPDKRCLGRLNFFHGKNVNGQDIVSKDNLFDLAANDGKAFRDIVTDSGPSLLEAHHTAFRYRRNQTTVFDISGFAKRNGKVPSRAYLAYLLLFSCSGILLEEYDMESREERRFVEEVVVPAFSSVEKKIGVRPLIVNLYDGDPGNPIWFYYPEFMKAFFNIP